MKKILLFFLASGMLFINLPQSLNGRFSSSVYTFERFDTTGASNTSARTYQMLAFNFGKENIWLRSNFNVEYDVASEMKNDPRFGVYNLYADLQKMFDVASLKLGRQPLYNSVAGGVLSVAKRLRELTRQKFNLPDKEDFTLEFVSDKSWGAYNMYIGGFQSRKISIPTCPCGLPNWQK